MPTNEVDYDVAELIGNVTVPRLALPTVRSSKRRSDADGISTVPYYSGVNAKKLDIEYTDSSLVVQTASLTIAGVGYADLIADITALDATNLEAIDMGGFLGIRNVNSGSTHYVKILPQSVSADEAAELLGLEVDPFPGSLSYAGELASSPGHRSQLNPQGTSLISKGDDLSSDALNRAFVSVLRSVQKLQSDLERDCIQYVDVSVTVQNHEISTGLQGFYLNDSTIRLPIKDLAFNSSFAGRMDGYLTLIDPVTGREAWSSTQFERVELLRVHHASSALPLSNGLSFVTWKTPNGGNIYFGDVSTKTKQAAVAITAIKGNVIYCPGALFETKIVQKNDPVRITGSTNDSPFSHNGWFAVMEVIDEEHLKLRPLGSDESAPSSGNKPFSLNSSGSGFGSVACYFGDFVPCNQMFFSLYTGISAGGLANGTYTARIACGRPVKKSNLDVAFLGKADASPVGLFLRAHLDDPTDAHASTAITGFTSATTWFDSTTIAGATLKATIEDILTDLSAATGTAKIGGNLITATGFVDPKTVSAGGLNDQLTGLLTALQTHESDSRFHRGTGWVSGFDVAAYSFPNQSVGSGVLVAEYLGEVRVFNVSSVNFLSVTSDAISYIYVDLTDGVMKRTPTLATAFSATTFPLWQIRPQGFGMTWYLDFRIPLSSSYSRNKGIVTVGPEGSDFRGIEAALFWIEYAGRAGTIPRTWELVIQGEVAMDHSVDLNFPITIRGAAKDASGTPLCKLITTVGQFSDETIAFNAGNGSESVVFRDIWFEVPTSVVSVVNPVIGSQFGHNPGNNWLIDNCVFSGGTNAPYISIDPSSTVPTGWVIRDCWFKTATRTSATSHIVMNEMAGWIIKGCRFEGQTGDLLQTGITISGTGSDENTIEDCYFSMGGRHIITSGTVDQTLIKNCRFRNSRATVINHLSSGEISIEGCYFTTCMTASSTAEAVIWADTGNGKLNINNCRFKNWGTGFAIRALSNTSVNSRIVNCVFTATAADRAIIGLAGALFMGNDFDLSPGAASGLGHDIAVVVSTLGNNRFIGNYFKNCGSTATSGSDTVLAFNDSCIASGNYFQNCRGTLIAVGGINCVVSGNVTNDVGAASTDIGVSVGYAGCVINGNVVTHTSSGQHFNISGNAKAQVQGNALSNAPTIFSGGLTGNAVRKRVVASIGSIAVTGGTTASHAFIPVPTNTLGVHIIDDLVLPAKVVNHEAGVRVTYDDGTQSTAFNVTASPSAVRIDDENAASNFATSQYLDLTDGLAIVAVEIVVRNLGATATQSLGQYRYRGWVIG